MQCGNYWGSLVAGIVFVVLARSLLFLVVFAAFMIGGLGGVCVGRLISGVRRMCTAFSASTTLRVRGNGGTTNAHTHGASLRLRGLVGRFHGISLRRSGG